MPISTPILPLLNYQASVLVTKGCPEAATMQPVPEQPFLAQPIQSPSQIKVEMTGKHISTNRGTATTTNLSRWKMMMMRLWPHPTSARDIQMKQISAWKLEFQQITTRHQLTYSIGPPPDVTQIVRNQNRPTRWSHQFFFRTADGRKMLGTQ